MYCRDGVEEVEVGLPGVIFAVINRLIGFYGYICAPSNLGRTFQNLLPFMTDKSKMSPVPMVDLQGQYKKLKPELDKAFQEVLDSCYFINGPIVHQFADNLASYLDVKHVIPCANGTDALQIALMALELKPGDEVITTPFTFVATAEVIALLGLKPVFVDVNPCTFAINEYQIEQAITERTRCIIPVHLFGQAANMQAIMEIADRHGLMVVEDNAQAIGADYIYPDGSRKKLGTIGQIGCTSFFPSKNLGAYGDGGALFTNDDDLAADLKMIVNHGMKRRYYHDAIGVNSRLDSLQAVVLNAKLPHLDTYNEARREAAQRYSEALQAVPGITVPKIASYSTHVFHQYTLLIDQKRDQVKASLDEAKIASGVYYPVPLHIQDAYRHYGYQKGDMPVSESLAQKVLSLPMHTELTPEVQDYIVDHVKKGME
jgi:UDP-2-acetamido-2-deoxy-ribo-hexuluronate aminotransferase